MNFPDKTPLRYGEETRRVGVLLSRKASHSTIAIKLYTNFGDQEMISKQNLPR